LEAYAPDSYIPLQSERLAFYQQLAACKTVEEIESIKSQLQDVYGVAPRQVENVFAVAELKLLANNAGIVKVCVKPAKGELTFADREKMMRKEVFEALADAGETVSAASASYGIVFSSHDYLQKKRLMDKMRDFLLRIQSK